MESRCVIERKGVSLTFTYLRWRGHSRRACHPDAAPVRQDDMSSAGHEQGAMVTCWLCGIRMSSSQMVPDGGRACDDVRWYCRDARACTERWPSARRQTRYAGPSWKPTVVTGRHQRS